MPVKIDSIEQIARIVYEAIFQNRSSVDIDGVGYGIRQTSKSKIRFVEIDGFTYIEQNPHKSSHWAEEARQGHQIMWVMQGRRYLARIRDGKFMSLLKK